MASTSVGFCITNYSRAQSPLPQELAFVRSDTATASLVGANRVVLVHAICLASEVPGTANSTQLPAQADPESLQVFASAGQSSTINTRMPGGTSEGHCRL